MPRLWIIIAAALLGGVVAGTAGLWQHSRWETLLARSAVGSVGSAALAAGCCLALERWLRRQEEALRRRQAEEQEEAQGAPADGDGFQPLAAAAWPTVPPPKREEARPAKADAQSASEMTEGSQ